MSRYADVKAKLDMQLFSRDWRQCNVLLNVALYVALTAALRTNVLRAPASLKNNSSVVWICYVRPVSKPFCRFWRIGIRLVGYALDSK